MKHLIIVSVFLIISSSLSWSIEPFFKMMEKEASISEVSNEIKEALKAAEFEILGEYNVADNENFHVIVFTNSKLKEIALSYPERGALAIAQKVSLIQKNGITTVSLLNPMYMFHAYFQKDFNKKSNELTTEIKAIKNVFSEIGGSFTPFGGDVSIDDLHKYQYMMGMPEFSDPVKLYTFSSFDDGVKTIRENLDSKLRNTIKVYEIVYPDKKVAVFGIGLLDAKEGEKHFLSIIGEDHLSAMPYEIILQENKVTMLHGRFRFALYWPELSMSTFTKIMSTPGDVEDFMEVVVE
ncbi:MAG: hypothetical protein JEY96_09285 [Bacteroidales bacterium]|nr:hypothetical protein [Bacteroidales bacterium]